MILISKLLRVWPPFRGFIAEGGFHVDETEVWVSGAKEAEVKIAGAQEAEIVT